MDHRHSQREIINTKALPCEGRWRLESGENFDHYLKSAGVGWFARNAATWVPTCEDWSIDLDTDTVAYSIICPGKTHSIEFTLGEWFREVTIDGRSVQNYYMVKGDKLICRQKGKIETVATRQIVNGTLVCTFEYNGKVARRWFVWEPVE